MTPGIVDSHHHLWDTSKLDHELFRDHPQLSGLFGPDQYEQDAAASGVTASICIEAASAGADGRAETEWLLKTAETSPLIRGIVAWAPLDDPRRLEPHLEWLESLDGKPIVGVRRSFEFEEAGFPRRAEVAAGARLAADHGLVVDLVLFSGSLSSVVALVDACPNTQFVLDHLGKPQIRDRVLDPWRDQLRALALRPNITAKLSGLPTEANPSTWTADDLRPYVEHALSTLGPQRLVYGSDWPLTILAGGHEQWLDAVRALISDLDFEDRSAILAGNAERLYRLSPGLR